MQTLRSVGMPAHLHGVPGSTKRGQCRHTTDLELPRTPGTACSLSCAWEKLWHETGPRSDECSWQAVYSPRTLGWAPSSSPSFANTVLPTTLSIVSWATSVTYCLFPLAMCSFLPPAFTGCLFLHELHSLPFFSTFFPSFFSCHFPPHQTCSFSTSRHFPGEALPVPLPWAAPFFLLHDSQHLWLVIRASKLIKNILSLLSSFHLTLQPLQAYEKDSLRKLRYFNDFIPCLWT